MSELSVDIEREVDGRWIGEVSELPGILAYGATREEAVAKTKALTPRVLAERREHGGSLITPRRRAIRGRFPRRM